MCGGFPVSGEAGMSRSEEILIRVRGTWPSSGVVPPVGMLNFPDKPSHHLLVGFTRTFSPFLLTGGFISGSHLFFNPGGDIL